MKRGGLYDRSIRLISGIFVLIGVVVVGITIAGAGGPVSVGVLIGAAFIAVGIGRILIQRRIGQGNEAPMEFRRILVPIFGTAMDDDIVSTAGRMAAEPDPGGEGIGAELVILQLTEVPLTAAIEDPLPAAVDELGQESVDRARDIASEYKGVRVTAERAPVRRMGTGIVAAARRLGVDAIVMGAEPPSPIRGGARLGGIGEYRPAEIGPVTAYVLRRAPCRVLLTAPPDPSAQMVGAAPDGQGPDDTVRRT
ncbi:MAG: universal stress protein [Actinomycetota bacterium]|nr:universal stress protein [Actinomycetota bacterium]